MTKEICSKCGPERICKNTNGGRLLVQNDDRVLQLHVSIEGCPIYKANEPPRDMLETGRDITWGRYKRWKELYGEPTQEEEGLEESVKHYVRTNND